MSPPTYTPASPRTRTMATPDNTNSSESKYANSSWRAAPVLLLICASFYIIIAIWLLLKSFHAVYQSRMDSVQIHSADSTSDNTERRRVLETEAPTSLLRTWWSSIRHGKVPPGEGDNLFTCAICLEPVLMGNTVHALGCRHVFHSQCLENWFLEGHNNCPLCQRSFCRVTDAACHSPV